MPVASSLERAEQALVTLNHFLDHPDPQQIVAFFSRRQGRETPLAPDLALAELDLSLRHLESQTDNWYACEIATLRTALEGTVSATDWFNARAYSLALFEFERFPDQVVEVLGNEGHWETLGRTGASGLGLLVRFTGEDCLPEVGRALPALLEAGLRLDQIHGDRYRTPEGWVEFTVSPGKEAPDAPPGS